MNRSHGMLTHLKTPMSPAGSLLLLRVGLHCRSRDICAWTSNRKWDMASVFGGVEGWEWIKMYNKRGLYIVAKCVRVCCRFSFELSSVVTEKFTVLCDTFLVSDRGLVLWPSFLAPCLVTASSRCLAMNKYVLLFFLQFKGVFVSLLPFLLVLISQQSVSLMVCTVV